MFELIYTSAPKGILPGRAGFSTVAFTAGMPANLLTPLENLSGYEFTFKGNTLPEECNPPVHSFIRLRYGASTLRIASRIAPNGLDYTMRNNKIAHHILFERDDELDCFPSGAAGLFGIAGNFVDKFEEAPHELAMRHIEECAAPADLPAVMWKKFTGDAGWAGVIAERFLHHAEMPFFVEYPLSVTSEELLILLGEVIELLPPEMRKDFTFSTYFTRERPGEDCFLRMVPEFSPLLGALKRFHPERILTLGEMREVAPEFAASELAGLAREGRALPDPPEIPEAGAPEPPLTGLRFKDVHVVSNAPKFEPPLPGLPERPRLTMTREYVPDIQERIAAWRKWITLAVAAAVAIILIIVGVKVAGFFTDVNVSGIKENVKMFQEELHPEPVSSPAATAALPPQVADPPASVAEKSIDAASPPEKAPEAAVPQELPEHLRAEIFLDLQSLVWLEDGSLPITLPRELETAQALTVLPDNRKTQVYVSNGTMRFSTLPQQRSERRKVLGKVKRLEFKLPEDRIYSMDMPRPGKLECSLTGEITYVAGEALPKGTAAFWGSMQLHDQLILTALPVKNYNESVRQLSRLQNEYLKQTFDGEPYTEQYWKSELKKIFTAPKSQTPLSTDRTIEALTGLIDAAPFARRDKSMHVSVDRMEKTLTEALEANFDENEKDEIIRALTRPMEDARKRERTAQEFALRLDFKSARSKVKRQLDSFAGCIRKLPAGDAEKRLISNVLWDTLEIREFDEKDKPQVGALDAPRMFTGEESDILLKEFNNFIQYRKVESGMAQ